MNTKMIKVIAAAACAVTALGLSFANKPAAPELSKKASVASAKEKTLLITNPEKSDDYGIGMYRVEGILAKGINVTISLDDKEVKDLTTNTEDGQYDLDVEVKEGGKHVLLLAYKDRQGKDVLQKLEFSASDKKMDEIKADNSEEANNEQVATNDQNAPAPEKVVAESNNEEPVAAAGLLPDETESSNDPNSEANRKASGVHDANIKPKVAPTKPVAPPKPIVKAKPAPTTIKKGVFVLSSHTNFNVVPHGIINIGGKGNPGDKIMLLVDNKPSMKGTVKPNGRWSFPVKIAKPGFRRITAQDLKSREAKSVKLKIK